jgi:hypothetical protein
LLPVMAQQVPETNEVDVIQIISHREFS